RPCRGFSYLRFKSAGTAPSILRSRCCSKFARMFEQRNVTHRTMTRDDDLRLGISALHPFCRSGPIGNHRITSVAQRASLLRADKASAIQNLLLWQPNNKVIHAVPSAGIEDLYLVLHQP